jgi:hypothetical protein
MRRFLTPALPRRHRILFTSKKRSGSRGILCLDFLHFPHFWHHQVVWRCPYFHSLTAPRIPFHAREVGTQLLRSYLD